MADARTSSTIDREARVATVTRVVDAPAEVLFDIIARPRKHPLMDGSGTVRGGIFGPERLRGTGERFGMFMRAFGVPYPIWSKVQEFEEGRRIAWSHLAGHRWRYVLRPVEGGAATEVTEQFDWSHANVPGDLYERASIPKAHLRSMARTLERLEGLARGHVPRD